MLGEFGGRIREFATAQADERADERVKETLMVWLMQSFPPLPPPEVLTYAFDRTVVDAADAWSQATEAVDENPGEAIRSLAECQRALLDKERWSRRSDDSRWATKRVSTFWPGTALDGLHGEAPC